MKTAFPTHSGHKRNERGNKEDFILVAERLLFHRPTDIEVCKELASIYLEQDYPQRALPKLHICYKSRPRDTEVLTILSSVFEQLHQTHKAVVTLKELARIYEESGLRNERDDALMSVLKLDPGDQEAKAALSSQKPLPKKSKMDSEIIFDEEAFLAKQPPKPPTIPSPEASGSIGHNESDLDDEIGFDISDEEEIQLSLKGGGTEPRLQIDLNEIVCK